ncbi:hypothetical protein EDD29_8318 [Actinocorallia herbida]|uniref:Uncharacterized protein n=2 Tax=Actinocorallia herbida TaxID=58109 RepID=A0A3N1DAN6_9ACTN|nr:hypothetical protein EDD29_8318 [Actinocorallia herbida]
MTHLAAVILADIDTASRWWLDRSLNAPDPVASWRLFDDIIRPMVAHWSSGEDQATRFARMVTTLLQRLDEEPDRLETFLRITEANFMTMGWHDLAADLRTPS